jgi:hypothetical protein
MKMKFAPFSLSGVVTVALLFLSSNCIFSPGVPPQGRLISRTDCKSSLLTNSQAAETSRAASQECAEYIYDGKSGLRLKHVNAGFNCCPGTVSADIQVSGGEIRIKEKESSSLCDCSCLYDLDYEFVGVAPGIYKVSVVGPYQWEGDPPLEFLVDLSGAASGSYCVERTRYPWSI